MFRILKISMVFLLGFLGATAYAQTQAEEAQQLQQVQQLTQQPAVRRATSPLQAQLEATRTRAERLRQQFRRQQTQISGGNQPPAANNAPAQNNAQRATQPRRNNARQNDRGGAVAPTQKQVMSIPDAIDEMAFRRMVKSLMPLKPEYIARLKKQLHENELAEASAPKVPPKPVAGSQFVNLAPGSTPPVIRLSQGFVTSVVFLDSTGSPWPIAAYDIGNPKAFNIQWDRKSNTMMIQAKTLYTYGNLAVRLRDLNTPVMLTLIPGQKVVDYRLDFRVQGYGPNATLPRTQRMPQAAGDPRLLSILDGVPPDGSTVLRVSGGRAQAWSHGGNLYLRTRLAVLSPGWVAKITSADGLHVYKMTMTPVVLVSDHGKVVKLRVG